MDYNTHQNWCTCMLHQSLLAWLFWADSNWLKFLMTMDYSPWSEREIWPFLRVSVSPKLERPRPPKLLYMHVTSIPTYMNFLSRFWSINFWWPWTIVMVRKGNLAVLESTGISETGGHAHQNCCTCMLHQSLLTWIFWADSDQLIFWRPWTSPWSEREIWPFLRVPIFPKLERPRPPKLVYMHVTSIPTCMTFLSWFQLIKIFDDHGL